jgi:outer membrane protein TolC
MRRRLPPPALALVLAAASGCAAAADTAREVAHNVILPEQRTVEFRDPAALPPAPIPPTIPPRTVSDPRPDTEEYQLSLDEAIRIALENARVVRVLSGLSATSSGQTIYDPAIINTTIDQQQARFDPNLSQNNRWERLNVPFGTFDPFDPTRVFITSTPTDDYLLQFGLNKVNVLGGQWALNTTANPTRVTTPGLPLNPQTPSAVTLSYTQPLLQGGGYAVNVAPIVIARLDTERSYFQYKDSVQELVRGVAEAYWTLVQARTDVWARKFQVDSSKEQVDREQARFKAQLGNRSNVAQAEVSYYQFRANLIAAEATVLAREGVLRNLLGLPPEDGRRLVPVSAPLEKRIRPDWPALVRLAEQRRPDIVELKLIVEADRQRLLQAENQALPRLDAVAQYRWNGLTGELPNEDHLSTAPGQFPDWQVGINFSVPLGLRAGRAQVRQQRLLIARDEANVQQGVHAAVADLALTVRNLDSAYEQYLAFKRTREAAYDNVQVQIAQFRTGRDIYLTVLQALNDFGNAVSSEAGALLTYNIALATLERQTGTILETHGLVFAEERFRAAGPIPCHDRAYPEADFFSGMPHRYPSSGEPSENAFDLRNPASRKEAPTPEQLPPPRQVPAP